MGSFLRGLGIGVVATALVLGGFAYMFRGVLPMILGAPGRSIPKDVAAEATTSTKEAREKILKELPFANKQDFEFAARGFIATLEDPKIKDDSGKVVFDLASYDFLKGDAPETANPSLWRQAQLITKHGLYKVHERIYQVRGFDVSTVSFIQTDKGYIVVDPLTTRRGREGGAWLSSRSMSATSPSSPSSIRTATATISAASRASRAKPT